MEHRALACGRRSHFSPRVICRIAFAFALCATCSLVAQAPAPQTPARSRRPQLELERQPDITADRIVGEERTGEAILTGNARLSDGTLLLLADEIRFNQKTNLATAVGRIQFTRENVRLLADRLTYNRTTGEFTADNIRLGSHPYFVEGFSAFGTPDEITIQRARASYGEPGKWQPTINADTILFAPGEGLRSENVTIGIGAAQPVPIPRFDHDFKAPLFLGAGSVNGGYRRSLGLFAEAAVLVPVAPTVRLGADLGIYTARGFMVGPAGRYSDSKDADRLRGYFRSGYINDHGDKGVDNVYGNPVPEHRAYAEWQHQQLLAPNLTLAVQAHWWKDPEVYRDFRSRAFFPLQEPDTFVESVYTGQNYFISAFARLQPNRFHRVQERLPEVRFDLLPHVIGPGLVQRFNASAAMLREDPVGRAGSFVLFPIGGPTTGPSGGFGNLPPVGVTSPFFAPGATSPAATLRTTRLDAYYGLSRPITPTEYFAFTPVAGGRFTHYSHTRVGTRRLGDYTRWLGEVGADVALRTSGTFNYKNEPWKIDGLRHLLTPRLSYRYIPEAGKGRAHIPPIDREAFSTYLQPLGLGDRRSIDDLRSTNTLRLAVDNILQTRDTKDGTRDLIALNLANDFRFRRQPGERDVSETHAELALTPAKWLQVDLYQSFAPQTFTLRELNSGITIKDAQYWAVRFSNNFLRHQIQDYLIDGRVRLNERLDWQTRLHYDARRRRFNEQTYGIVQNLGNTWLISYNVSVYSGRRRESSFGFNIRVDTVGF